MKLRGTTVAAALAFWAAASMHAAAVEPEPTPVPVEHDWGWSTHTLWDGCREYTGFAVYSDSRRTSDYTFEYSLILRSPSGNIVDTVSRSGAGLSFNHQDLGFEVCSSHGAGLYALTWELRWFDPEGTTVFENTRAGDVRFYRIASRSSLRVSDTTPKRGSIVTYKVRAMRDTPDGSYEPYSKAVVALFKNCSGSWAQVRDSKLRTDADGRLVLKRVYDTRESCKFRAKTFPTDRVKPSRSSVLQLFPH